MNINNNKYKSDKNTSARYTTNTAATTMIQHLVSKLDINIFIDKNFQFVEFLINLTDTTATPMIALSYAETSIAPEYHYCKHIYNSNLLIRKFHNTKIPSTNVQHFKRRQNKQQPEN